MIGIFDSGVGGLTVLKEYLKRYPDLDYVYLGDQANSPYGSRSTELVNKLVVQNIEVLVQRGCELIIIACNTASADALRHVQGIYRGKPVILGVLIPAVEAALKATRNGRIGVIGTRGTVNSGAYERELNKYAPALFRSPSGGEDAGDEGAGGSIQPFLAACPLLVPLVEEGLIDHPVTRELLRGYLQPLKEAGIDTLILGCTHYPLLENAIREIVGDQITLISSARAAGEAIEDYFSRHPSLESRLSHHATRVYLTTDNPDRFSELGSRILGESVVAERLEY